MPELVQAYNNNTHASTGFSPHFLLFGQEPQLPVDYLLGRAAPSAVGPTDRVRQHRLRLQDAQARALKHLQQAVTERVKQTDQRAADHPLNVGDLVYMRNRVVGRSKIQGRWRPELYVVTARPYPGIHVDAVKPFSGGQERTVSRDDLLHARTPLEVAKDVPLPALDASMPPEQHYPDQGEFWLGRPVNVGPAPSSAPASATTDIQQPVTAASSSSRTPDVDVTTSAQPALRRSSRVNKGINPDAANVPRSALWRPYHK